MQTINNYLESQDTNPALCSLITTLLNACTHIASKVGQGELAGVLGVTTEQNIQGETQKKLDVISNDILKVALLKNKMVKTLASEEEDFVVAGNENGNYVVAFDPLDGSSNIDINGQIGTIFTIYAALKKEPSNSKKQFSQKGSQQLCAGYVLYGASTLLVISVGGPTKIFTLDRTRGDYFMSNKDVTITHDTNEFSINIANYCKWPTQFKKYVEHLIAGENDKRAKRFNMRWNGSMVGDMHRILYRGGIFCYPSDISNPHKPAKLRLLYEANPIAFLVENAKGKAYTENERILDVTPYDIHQRVPVIIGSAGEVDICLSYLKE